MTGEIQASGGFTLDGHTEGSLAQGAVHMRSYEVGTGIASLQADAIDVTYAWANGTEVGQEGNDAIISHEPEIGTHSVNFTQVHANLTKTFPQPEVLAILPSDQGNITLQATGRAQANAIEDQTITSVGFPSDSSVAANDGQRQGFSYTVQGPWTMLTQLDAAVVQGSFTLFVNNLTLDLTASETEKWEHPTGRWTESGPAPGVQEFQRRITLINVTDGRLWISVPDQLRAMGPRAAMTTDGSFNGDNVEGVLEDATTRYHVDGAELGLIGQGQTVIEPLPAGGSSYGLAAVDASPSLKATVEGDYEVRDTPGVDQQALDQSGSDLIDTGLSVAPWLALLLVLGAVGYTTRDRALAWYTHHKADKRRDREDRWRRAGDRAFEAREYEGALSWYQRIVDAYPNSIDGWNSLAATLEELQRYDEAADAYETTADMMDQDARLLTQAAGCAWQAGQEARAVDLAAHVAASDPGALSRWLGGPRFRGLREHETVLEALEEEPGSMSASYV